MRVAGLVLAAGSSSRMGQNKLLLRVGESTLLRRAVTTAAAGGLDPILVVLGHEPERARTELADLPCTTVWNPEHARGINTSLRAGAAALPDDADGAVVLLADMPFVTADMIGELVDRWRAAAAPLAISCYDDVVAPPILYGRSLFPELRALDGDGCGKQVVKRHRGEAVALTWPAERLADLDVPADLERVRARLEAR